jgi:hypothetical protein
MLCDGPVRVPSDAAAGKATLEVVLLSDTTLKSTPTTIEVELVDPAAGGK